MAAELRSLHANPFAPLEAAQRESERVAFAADGSPPLTLPTPTKSDRFVTRDPHVRSLLQATGFTSADVMASDARTQMAAILREAGIARFRLRQLHRYRSSLAQPFRVPFHLPVEVVAPTLKHNPEVRALVQQLVPPPSAMDVRSKISVGILTRKAELPRAVDRTHARRIIRATMNAVLPRCAPRGLSSFFLFASTFLFPLLLSRLFPSFSSFILSPPPSLSLSLSYLFLLLFSSFSSFRLLSTHNVFINVSVYAAVFD